ncbi:MAG: NAD(P)H-binding protein [Planctomycetota bacterium]|jgi:uncharacterized protein YbjT (DUF2867 family)
MNKSKILITGATGKTGRRVHPQLVHLGHEVRLGSRSASIPFDWYEPDSWAEALEGMQAVYMSFFPDLAVPDAPEIIQRFTELAVASGVEKLVLLSGRGETHAQRCERIVEESGVATTILRASWFAQNFSEGHFLEAVRSGRLAVPAARMQEPFLDIDDLCEVAVAALTQDCHTGQCYELTGPELLTFGEAAARLSKAAGYEVEYAPISFEENHAMLTELEGSDFATLITELCREVLDGRNAFLGDGVQRALGREPRSFAQYCDLAAESGCWDRPVALHR